MADPDRFMEKVNGVRKKSRPIRALEIFVKLAFMHPGI